MKEPDYGARFDDRRGPAHRDQHHSGGRRRNRNRRVHRDAQRTVIGSNGVGVDMRDLDDGQQRKQNKTQHSNHRQSSALCLVRAAKLCLQSCQHTFPLSFNLQNIGRADNLESFAKP